MKVQIPKTQTRFFHALQICSVNLTESSNPPEQTFFRPAEFSVQKKKKKEEERERERERERQNQKGNTRAETVFQITLDKQRDLMCSLVARFARS